MISLSTPFSFETASTTIRISLLIANHSTPRRLFRHEPSRTDLLDRDQPFGSLLLDPHLGLTHPFQQTSELAAALHWHQHLEPHLASGIALEMTDREQRPVKARRR